MAPPRQGAPEHTRRWQADVVLRDGGVARVRPIVPADAEALQAFHVAQSPRSTYQRFFVDVPRLSPRDLHRFTSVDHRDRVALVAEVAGTLIGVGRYERLVPEPGADAGPDPDAGEPARVAEVAFNVADGHQGRGVGSVLLEHLAAAADDQGVARFRAVVLEENTRMLDVLADAGYATTAHADDGLVVLEMDLAATPRSLSVIAGRQAHAEAASLRALLAPSSVVLVGASRTGTGAGAHLLSHLLSAGFTGEVAVVHPARASVQGVTAYPTVGQVPFVPDLAVIAVPAPDVVAVVRACAARGVRAVVVVSVGFAEDGGGAQGLARQHELVATTRSHGMRLLGPASFGVVSTAAAVRLNASLAPCLPQPGRLALFSQSGALGVAVLDAARRRHLGVSSLVSAGNRADVSGNDCLHYWSTDPETSVVGMYLESIGNPRTFTRAARALSGRKPVVVVSSGLSGRSVPPGHRPLRTAAPPEAFDALLRQAGVVRVSTVHQLFDVAQLLVHQPLPAGGRVAVVGSAALARLAAEAAHSWHLEVAPARTLAPDAGREEMVDALARALGQADVDAVLACFVPSVADVDLPVARVVADAVARAGRPRKPVLACLLGLPGVVGGDDGLPGADAVPVYPTPEDAVLALAAAVRYAQWRARPPEPPAVRIGPGAVATARDLVRAALREAGPGGGAVVLGAARRRELLGCYGIALARPGGGDGPDRPEPGEVEVVLRSTEDELFGPLVSLGLRGDALELMGDVAHRAPPLSALDASDLVRSLRAAPLLLGRPGSPGVDVAALEDLAVRLARMADDLPALASVVLDPVAVGPGGVRVRGARVEVAAPAGSAEPGRRALDG